MNLERLVWLLIGAIIGLVFGFVIAEAVELLGRFPDGNDVIV